MKVFRYFGPLLLFCLSQLIFGSNCKADTHAGNNHVKRSRKEPVPGSHGEKNGLTKDLKHKNVKQATTKDNGSTPKKQDGSSSVNLQSEQLSKENKIHIKHSFHLVAKTGGNLTRERAKDVRSETTKGKTTVHSKKSNFKNIKDQAKPSDLHSKKKMVVKKYSLLQSTNPFQSESEYPPIIGGGQDLAVNDDQTGDDRDQEFSPEEQQQQPIMSEGNSPLQYGASQDSAGFQQENSQASIASFATSNGEDTSQSEGAQPSSLEQAIQMQQAGYTQQSQEQGQDEESIRPDSQGGNLAGQGSQFIDAGQLQQYQGEQASQGQEQEQEQDQGAQQQGDQEQNAQQQSDQEQNAQQQSDQEQNAQEQTVGQTGGFEQTGFQQEQPQELDQQQSQGIDQQQQDQTQEYQQQEEQQQQPSEETQESEGVPSESQGLATSSNSYGGFFGAEGQQTAVEQQGQEAASYTNEQSNEGADKTAPPPGVQYASSIEEALKEPSVSPQESQESNSEGGESQGSVGANGGASVINISPETDSKEGSNNGFIGAGTVSAPTGYQASTVDDNGNPIQTGTENNVNGYAPINDHAANGEANGFEENQQLPSSSSSESSNAFNFAQQKPASGTKESPLADDIYKIISIANKNGPTAVKGCKGCPPHARCIDKVCIINDDHPLAHILSALSGPEPDHVSVSDEQSPPNECKEECHYNAKCINRECICKSGYTGDGLDCRPDTCLPGCKQHGKCIKGFCLCDHHHYFNGYECAPYKITHRNCPIQCATRCHARCPPNCCRHHPDPKMHYDSGNSQQINVSPNAPPSKPKNGPRPTEVVLKPIVEVGEAITNFAPDFQKRPGESDASNMEAITLKEPTGGFSVSQPEAKPLVADAGCPDQCKTKCRDTCPVRCCLGKCPVTCMEQCHQSCPKTCCYIHGTKNPFPMIDPKVQENFMKTMAAKFCPSACKTKCDSKCPPICCEGNSSSVAFTDANFQQLKSESKNNADFFRNAMSWFGMMNFLNMMYSMYGNLYNSKHKKYPLAFDHHKIKTIHPTKPKSIGAENHIKFKAVGVAEKTNDSTDHCPGYCSKTCLHLCPPRCCHNKQNDTVIGRVSTPLRCLPSCSWFCSNSCPAHCCSSNKKPLVLEHHPTEQIKIAKSSPIAPPRLSLAAPPAACTPNCPAYCYPHCLENCCRRGEVPPFKPATAQEKAKQSYSNFFSKTPAPSNQDCPTICQKNCAPSCPVRCCAGSSSSPPSPNSAATFQAQTHAPLCPGNCVSECFPACTISCCRADLNKNALDVNNPTENPTRRHNQPKPVALSFHLPPPIALCHPGCSRSCYPNCDETCCRASTQHAAGFKRPIQVDSSSSYTIRVPCPTECRPYNCLYYCHHDCCLRGKEPTDLKRRQAARLQDQMKYLNGMRKKKTMASRLKFMHVASDKKLGNLTGTKG